MLVRNIGVCLTALLALSLGVAGCSNQSDESVSSSSGFVDKSGGVSAPASDLSVFSAERRGGDGGGSSSSGGYGYYGKFPAATFQPFYPSDCVDNPATCFWKPAECAVAPTAVFTANQEVVSVTASGNGANGVKGKFTFRDEIGGIQPKYKINDVRGAGSNGAGPYTILASTTSSITHETTLTVAESTVAFSGSALGNIEYEFEQLIPDCSVNGIHPLYIYGWGFPYSDQTGVSLTIRLQERTMPAPIGYQPLCDLFVLGGANYRFVDQSNASFDVPTYDSDWNTWEGCPDGDTGSNGPVLCADGSRRCNCHGQVKPELYGCSGDIGDRRAGLTIGAADQEYSTVLSAFAFGSRQGASVKPQIDYVCVTERQDWDSGGFNDKECSPNGSKGNGTQGDIRARTGDILTIVGRNFQRSNEAPVCLSATDCSPRKRIPLDVEVVVGGVHVADGVASKFALVNGLKSDLRNGECTNDNEAGGGICQRIHVVVPKIPAQKIPLFVGAAVQNKTLDRDEYGGQPALGVSGDPGDRKIKYYGGVGPTDPVDTTPPPPVRIVQALAGGTDSIEVSFEEVGDDPAGLPNAGLPVRNYVLKRASSPISSETDFSNSFAFQPDPAGHDPSVGDAFGHLPPWQTLSFTGLAPRSTYCFSAKAVDRSGNISLLRVPAGDGGPDGVFCATTDDIPRPNTPPCPIVLAAEKGDDPTHQIRLNWVEVRENGWDVTSRSCVNPDGGPVAELVLKYKEGPVDFPSDQFGDKIDNPLGLILHDQEDDGTVPLYSRPPGDNHSVQVSGLQSGSSYIFAIRSKDAEGLPSEVSGHVAYATDPIVTPTPVGNSEFVDLSSNLPRTTNVENSLHILPSVWDGQPWVLLADPSAGIQIFKVADDDNVSCKKQDGTFDTACIFTPDDFPKDTQTPPRWVGDLQRDFLDRDRHVLRTGAGFDCDGLDAVQQIPSNVDWTKVDTFTRCNLPRHPVYGADLNKASMVAVGDVNGDEHEDLVIANHSANQVPDAAFINSGYDLCNRPGRTDVADGIPCFLSPVTLPSQLAGDKRPSSRVRLYDAVEGDGGADLIFVLTGQMEIGGLSVYENRCKNRPLQNCQSNDFVLRTDLIDVGGDERLLPVYCEDVAFVDLDGDESRDRDMICVRSESFTTPDNHGVNLTFEAISPSESPDGLPHFRLNRNLLSAATANNCNHSFGESAKGTNGQDYLAIGYRKLGGSAAGQGTSCRTRLFAGDGGGLAEALLPGMSNQDNCHNGALADTRGLGRMDFAAACGQLEDLSSDFGGNPEFRGMKILLNGGVNLGVDGFDLGMNVFEDFEAAGLRLFRSAVDSAGRPTLLPGPPRIFQDVDDPGAATAVGIGDLNRDGVPDIYFGNGATSVGGSALDRVFRQMKR